METTSGGEYTLGKRLASWGDQRTKTVTFIVTKDCQLICRYCYLVGKTPGQKMSREIAERSVEYLLGNRELFPEKGVIWEFIGGEPFLEIELIDRICDTIKRRMFELDHPWFDAYRFSFATNGILYGDERVQRFIRKNAAHLSIGISIDGTAAKHDMNRVYPGGGGSYADVVRNIPLWRSQFPRASTKVTVSREDLPLIKESVLHLWELGIREVAMNVVFEDVWEEGDDLLFEEQMMALADHILEHGLYKDFNCTLFEENLGGFLDPVLENRNWCGSGKMLAIDAAGNFYPCLRFADFSLAHHRPRTVGNCFQGIDHNRLRPFLTLDRFSQSSRECMECEVNSGCAWCQGANYDFADTETIFQRATFICKMHKARVRANRYYWDRFRRREGA